MALVSSCQVCHILSWVSRLSFMRMILVALFHVYIISYYCALWLRKAASLLSSSFCVVLVTPSLATSWANRTESIPPENSILQDAGMKQLFWVALVRSALSIGAEND